MKFVKMEYNKKTDSYDKVFYNHEESFIVDGIGAAGTKPESKSRISKKDSLSEDSADSIEALLNGSN